MAHYYDPDKMTYEEALKLESEKIKNALDELKEGDEDRIDVIWKLIKNYKDYISVSEFVDENYSEWIKDIVVDIRKELSRDFE